MGQLNTSTDQLDPEAVPTVRQWSRWMAPFLLFASLSLTVMPAGYWGFAFARLLALVFLVLSIVWGILARQWIFVSVVVGTMVGIAGLGILVVRPGHGHHNESAAVANLRTINTAEVTYLSNAGTYGSMTDLIAAQFLDDTFTGTKAGYNYSITMDATSYTAEAVPASTKTGRYGYYTVPDAVVRYSTTASLAPTAAQAGKSVQ
jgi:hypothetical protein